MERENDDDKLYKYWKMRYDLFSKFDDGILLDRESFYCACPEEISYTIANECPFKVGMDPFCGAGGNAIQMALVCNSVTAIDTDPNKIKLAKHNAELYGVRNKIKFFVADFFRLDKCGTINADVLITSPPRHVIDNGGCENLIRIAKCIAPRVVLRLPKNANVDDCVRIGANYKTIKFEDLYLNGQLNCLTVFYSSFTNWYDESDECEYSWRKAGRYRGRDTRVRQPKITRTEVRLCSTRDEEVRRPYDGRENTEEMVREYMDSVESFLTRVPIIVPG